MIPLSRVCWVDMSCSDAILAVSASRYIPEYYRGGSVVGVEWRLMDRLADRHLCLCSSDAGSCQAGDSAQYAPALVADHPGIPDENQRKCMARLRQSHLGLGHVHFPLAP